MFNIKMYLPIFFFTDGGNSVAILCEFVFFCGGGIKKRSTVATGIQGLMQLLNFYCEGVQ